MCKKKSGATAIELANKDFLESVARALYPGGVMFAPADSFWLDNFTLEDTIAECRQIFKRDDWICALLQRRADN